MPIRLVALVRATDIHPRTRHSVGLPAELSTDNQPGESLPWPRVLVIQEKPDGIFLDRYTEDGRSGGDTWHFTLEDAKDQAEDEYTGLVTAWKDVPPEIAEENVVMFALSELNET